jgi:hypothetical protein
MTERILAVAAALAVLAWPGATSATSAQNTEEERVVVTVVHGETHAPVVGLPVTAFAIREDNLDREVVRVQPATDPIAVVLLTDTTTAFAKYPRDLRTATQAFLTTFLEASPQSSVALWEFGGADIPVADFTSDLHTLQSASLKLFPKGSLSNISGDELASVGARGGQNVVASNLLEGVVGASRALSRRTEHRRAIVSFNSDLSVEASALTGQRIQDEVEKAGASWFATSLAERVANGPLRDNVMNVLCPVSGGLRTTIIDIAALEHAMEMAARTLASQYLVTYRRPAGSAPRTLLVGLRVEGLKAYAPRWAPQ